MKEKLYISDKQYNVLLFYGALPFSRTKGFSSENCRMFNGQLNDFINGQG